jgi:hypothetical protein
VLSYEDGAIEMPRPARVQRICARAVVGADDPAALCLDPVSD